MERLLTVLYTGQKKKKAKTWHDGKLKIIPSTNMCILYSEEGDKLDSKRSNQCNNLQVGDELEMDRYFVQIDSSANELNQLPKASKNNLEFIDAKSMLTVQKRKSSNEDEQVSLKKSFHLSDADLLNYLDNFLSQDLQSSNF
jgi:hypothetical protein